MLAGLTHSVSNTLVRASAAGCAAICYTLCISSCRLVPALTVSHSLRHPVNLDNVASQFKEPARGCSSPHDQHLCAHVTCLQGSMATHITAIATTCVLRVKAGARPSAWMAHSRGIPACTAFLLAPRQLSQLGTCLQGVLPSPRNCGLHVLLLPLIFAANSAVIDVELVRRRLDYFLTSPDLGPHCHDSFILSDFLGSDHCPLGLALRKSASTGSTGQRHTSHSVHD
jgi:hypothetical protein